MWDLEPWVWAGQWGAPQSWGCGRWPKGSPEATAKLEITALALTDILRNFKNLNYIETYWNLNWRGILKWKQIFGTIKRRSHTNGIRNLAGIFGWFCLYLEITLRGLNQPKLLLFQLRNNSLTWKFRAGLRKRCQGHSQHELGWSVKKWDHFHGFVFLPGFK